jgi:acetolactate synthase-1/2/3 large subunit
MADVTARLTGVPGICHSTFGPGATSLATGAGSALLDRSPVLLFTSEMPDQMLRRTSQMNIDHQALFTPLTKATFRMTPENAGEVLASAFKICTDQYPGPVHIGLPSDIADREVRGSFMFEPVIPVPASYNDSQKIVSLLENSGRPLLALGLTAARLNIGEELLRLLENFRIPVVITPMAKGIIPDDHPCYAGVLFHALSDYLDDLFEKTDLVIGIGYDQVELNYESWIRPEVPLIHFDTRPADMPEDIESVQYAGPPGEWFSLIGRLKPSSLNFEQAMIRSIRDEMSGVFSGFCGHFGPVSVLKVLMEEIPDNTIVTADVGSHLHLLGQYWKIPATGKLIITNGWSSMGFGIPAAIAASLCRPDSTIVCITGDGGFLMMAGELITARRYNLPVITVVMSDGELNLIKLKQAWKNYTPYSTELYQGELFGSDVFLGIKVINAGSPDEMRRAFNTALALDEPVIINATIDPEDYKWLIVRR